MWARGGWEVTVRTGRALAASAIVVAAVLAACVEQTEALQTWDRVVFSEIYYYVPGFDAHNEYIEIENAGGTVAFLDGAVISDEGDDGMPEPIFRFPGVQGGYDYPIWPGERMVLARDAVVGELTPDLSDADWEFVHPSDDNDNPNVPNIMHCGGYDQDLALANGGDGILLATGADTTTTVDCWTVVDGVNWDGVTDPVPIGYAACSDAEPAPGVPQGNCLGRCPGGIDHNGSSAEDWFMMIPSPGEVNIPSHPSDCSSPVESTSWGRLKALYRGE